MANTLLTAGAGGGGGDLVLISTATASSSSSIDFTGLDNTYSTYVIQIIDAVPSESSSLVMRTSSNNGSSYDSGATDYGYVVNYMLLNGTTSISVVSNGSSSSAQLFGTNAPGTNVSYNAEIRSYNNSGSFLKQFNVEGISRFSNGITYKFHGGAERKATSAVNAIQILMSSGTISTGTFKLYGIK